MDEPTNHLDMISKDVLKQAILDYSGTLIVVSHDRDFLKSLTNKTIEFRNKKLYEHLGDIEYFLEKRKLENMREVELKKNQQQSQADKVLTNEEFQERKKLQRAVQNVEKKISKLEEKIAEFETQMADNAFYESADSQKRIANFEQTKKDLEAAMETWEEAQANLEKFE